MNEVKAYYRSYFAQCSEFVKMSYFLRLASVSKSNFSKFMKDPAYDFFMSEKKLQELASLLKESLDRIT